MTFVMASKCKSVQSRLRLVTKDLMIFAGKAKKAGRAPEVKIIITRELAERAWMKEDDKVDIGIDVPANKICIIVSDSTEESCGRLLPYKNKQKDRLLCTTTARAEWGNLRNLEKSLSTAECEVLTIKRGEIIAELPEIWKQALGGANDKT